MNTIKICMLVHKNFYPDGRVRRYAESPVQTGASVDIICPVLHWGQATMLAALTFLAQGKSGFENQISNPTIPMEAI